MCADTHVRVDHALRVDRHVIADLAVSGDDRISADGDMGSKLNARMDECRRVNPWLRLRRPVEQFQGLGEGEVGMGSSQKRHGGGSEVFSDDHRRSARRFDEGGILRIGDEGQLAGLGFGDRGNSGDVKVLTIKPRSDMSGDVGEPHGDVVHGR